MNLAASNTAKILRMQSILESMPENMKGIPDASHVYADNACARTLMLPKGSIVVGKMHRDSHLNVISYGHVKVLTFEGNSEYIGHNVFVSPATVKRCVYALEDTCWTVIHLTNSKNEKDLEDEVIIADDSDEFLDTIKNIIGGVEWFGQQ